MSTLWAPAVDRARALLARLPRSDKIAIALHDFASVQDPDIVVFDYADGPNGVRGHLGANAFPSMLAMAASQPVPGDRRGGDLLRGTPGTRHSAARPAKAVPQVCSDSVWDTPKQLKAFAALCGWKQATRPQ